MKRSHWLLLAVGIVFVLAATLRVRSHLARNREPAATVVRTTTMPAEIAPPRDYVAHPMVAPGEADRGPRRIVSLAPSITEMICALGMRDRLVGRTPFCLYPPGVESVPQVGALLDTNFEKIRSLDPDLVLTTRNSGPVPERLRELGLRTESVPHDSLEEVYTAIERLGQLCDRPRTARTLVKSIEADLAELGEAAAGMKMARQKVLIVDGELPVPPKPIWVAGPGSFLDALVALAGHENAAAGVLTASNGELPLEKLLTLDIDIILTFGNELSASQWADLYQSWGQLGSLRAIREHRVRRVGGKEWLSSGPRIALAMHRLVEVLSEFR